MNVAVLVLLVVGVCLISVAFASNSSNQPESCTKNGIKSILLSPKHTSDRDFTLYNALNCENKPTTTHPFRMKPGICYELKDFENQIASVNRDDWIRMYRGPGCVESEWHLPRDDVCTRLNCRCEPCGCYNPWTSSVQLGEIPFYYAHKRTWCRCLRMRNKNLWLLEAVSVVHFSKPMFH